MNDNPRGPNDQGVGLGHESTDVDPRGLLWFASGLFATLVLAGAFVWWLLATYSHEADVAETPLSPFAGERHEFPQPRLVVVSTEELRKLRASEEEQLNSAAWIDRPRNIARIPIARAIEIVAKDGLPRWPAAPAGQPTENAEERP